MQIVVIGMGYVGTSTALILARQNEVTVVDIDQEKINKINQKISPVEDNTIQEFLETEKLNICGMHSTEVDYAKFDFAIIALPTNYNLQIQMLDMTIVEETIKDILKCNPESTIIIKSTIPIGYIDMLRKKFEIRNIILNPEFLREDLSLIDSLYPTRIVLGIELQNYALQRKAETYLSMIKKAIKIREVETKIVSYKEAEAIKLFSNTYLAMRIAFFNELDTYAEVNDINAKVVIEGMALDPRIGDYYNNPSFGYGGSCLPKDTKQLLANYYQIPQKMISAIVEANEERIAFIVDQVFKMLQQKEGALVTSEKRCIVGIYRLNSKKNSTEIKNSILHAIIKKLNEKGICTIIYEPILSSQNCLDGNAIENNLEQFKKKSHIVLANRYEDELWDIKEKVYTRDLFKRD